MSINSVSNGNSSASAIQALVPAPTTPATTGTSSPSVGVSVDISKPGQLLSDLDSLAQSDPDKFKAVTGDIAKKLKDAAAAQTGGRADFLNKLADRFSAASQSGNASDLTPPNAGKAHAHHGHGGHHRAAAAGAAGQPGAPDDSVANLIQGIVSSSLSSTSSG
jgi:hypothetical protein